VRYVDAENRVRFAPTTQVDESETGLWLSGLPDVANIIVEGQDFVSIGSEVTPRQEAALNTSPAASLASTQLK
jgi:multidrug efflux system membrane fusion protein